MFRFPIPLVPDLHLQVLLNNEGTVEGSLLKLLGRCITPSGKTVGLEAEATFLYGPLGKRLFRIWLSVPLREISSINAR